MTLTWLICSKNYLMIIHKMNLIKCIILLIISSFTNSYVLALSTDNTKPLSVDLNPGYATFNQDTMATLLNGHIVITRGTIKIVASSGEMTEDTNKYKFLKLYGSPIEFAQQQDDKTMLYIWSNRCFYNTKNNTLVLSGLVKIKKNNDIILGETVTYNTTTHLYTIDGVNANGVNKKKLGRVTIIIDSINKK